MNLLKVLPFLFLSLNAQAFFHNRVDVGTMIDLARSDKDQAGDNSFVLDGEQYTVDKLDRALTGNLPVVLGRMKPTTDDPSIRNVSMKINGNDVEFDFQKHVAFFWKSASFGGSTLVANDLCSKTSQIGYKIDVNMSDSTSAQAQGYVNGVRILMCAEETTDLNGHHLSISIERDLFAGPEYQDWIGLLMGDFLRTYGQALEASLK